MSAAAEPAAPAEAERRASGSSFYAAMRILPEAQRRAMYEIYSFCRLVDDIADDPGTVEAKRAGLQRWREDIDGLYRGTVVPSLAALAEAVGRFGLRREDFHAVIDGMEMDVLATIRAPDAATLDLYCDRVASAVGRLSVRVFGMEEKAGLALAHHLGRALQLTNILRDIDEDAGIGRLYLPREALDRAGIPADEPAIVAAHPALPRACADVAETVRGHFGEAEAVMAASPRRAVRAPRIMGAAYRLIFETLMARGFAPPRAPVKLRKPQFLWILARNYF